MLKMRDLLLVFCLVFVSTYKPILVGANCPVKTRNRGCCVFPFVYGGVTYNKCVNGRSPWCSQTPSYDRDRKWDYCVGLEGKITVDDRACVYANGHYMGRDNGRWNVVQSYMFSTDLEVVAIKANNTGGPGGLLASFSNGVRSDASWKCTTNARSGWQGTNFDDSSWPNAVVHGANGNTVSGIASDVTWIGVGNFYARQFFCRRRITVRPQRPPASPACIEALGLESGWIGNSAITASSNWDAQHMAWRARLNLVKQGSFTGGWSARINDANQWIQVDLGRSTRVTAVATQGRQDYDQWVTGYTLSYGNNPADLSSYRVNGHIKQFTGNKDRNSVVKHTLSPAAEGRYLRLYPKTWKGHISMRLELYGCSMTCKVDIGIIMDESGSVSQEDWVKEKTFVKDLSDHFKFGRDAAQFGVISFSTDAHLDIQLNSNSNGNSFKRALDNIKQARGWTFTAKALNLAYSQLFSASKGARTKVAKVLLVITDGMTNGGTHSLKAPTKRLKDSSVNIFTIGVGSSINKAELLLMASNPTNSHVFYVTQMEKLKDLIISITTSSCSSFTCRYVSCEYGTWSGWSKSCGQGMTRVRRLSKVKSHTIQQQGGCAGMKQTCDAQMTETKDDICPCHYVSCSWNEWGAWSATCGKMTRIRTSKVSAHHTIKRPNCEGLQTTCPWPESANMYISCCKAEVGIMLDESGSVSADDFIKEKSFVAAMANGFGNYGPDGIQMGVISFSTDADVDIKLGQYRKKEDFVNAVKSIVQFRGWTYTNKALTLARTSLFQSGRGARPGVSKVLVILTDGASTSGIESLREPVRLLKESHVNIFSIGIGNRVYKKELDLMASLPTESHVFNVASMSELPKLLQRISDASCQAFTCKYVTCEYGGWSAWSASCGKSMRRTGRLVKVTEHTKQQQGGCSGLTTTCEKSKTETKDMNCSCRYVSCSWKAWSAWSATCGSVTRRRENQVSLHVTNRPSCSGLQTTCPAPEVQSRTTNCACKGVSCSWNAWSSWSASCGAAHRQRTIKSTPIVKNQPDCSNIPQKCTHKPQVQSQTTDCVCSYVDCVWNPYSSWSATCGRMVRTRTIKAVRKTIKKPDCSGLKQKCTEKPQIDKREVKCTCKYVKCTQNPWTEWSATCGKATRQRTWKTTQVTEQKLNCDGLTQSCPAAPEVQKREKMCTCNYVKCTQNTWTEWSATCGKATRQRTWKTTQVTEQKLSCDGLTQSCPAAPEVQKREKMCTCNYVKCTQNPWTDWSATCGKATRQRAWKTTQVTEQKLSCDGLTQSCPAAPEVQKREKMCTCNYVKCTQNPWTDWSATCGKATRQRTWKTTQVSEEKLSCDGLKQSCPSKPEVDKREILCPCKTVECVPGEWGNWSNDCGKVKRQRNITETPKVVQKLNCDGLLQKCPNKYEEQTKTLGECQECFTVSCLYGPWQPWSATCGPATRIRQQNIEELFVFRKSCENLPTECTGDFEQKQTRNTPPCPTTPKP